MAQTQPFPSSPSLFPDSFTTPVYHEYAAPHSFPTAMFKELQDQQRHLASLKARSPKPKRSHTSYPVSSQPVFQPTPISLQKPMVQPTFQTLPDQHSGPPGFVPWVPPRSKPDIPDSACPVIPLPESNTLSTFLTQLTLTPPKTIPVLSIAKVASVTSFSDTDSSTTQSPLPAYQTHPPAPDASQAPTEPIIYKHGSEVDIASQSDTIRAAPAAPHIPPRARIPVPLPIRTRSSYSPLMVSLSTNGLSGFRSFMLGSLQKC
ncbi:proline-rich receptor-like protein kinase PERK2 [Telopea speciosissima]|uniref:proline-rich receptor-like protein kinase PERK2 n=1 Tax=Telopea speciosissima TaxID=54955 RepID=UPI001CC7CD77|nr:proline-rich receptor-like protein kinase PERK2 [Telopea speciosissima]